MAESLKVPNFDKLTTALRGATTIDQKIAAAANLEIAKTFYRNTSEQDKDIFRQSLFDGLIAFHEIVRAENEPFMYRGMMPTYDVEKNRHFINRSTTEGVLSGEGIIDIIAVEDDKGITNPFMVVEVGVIGDDELKIGQYSIPTTADETDPMLFIPTYHSKFEGYEYSMIKLGRSIIESTNS